MLTLVLTLALTLALALLSTLVVCGGCVCVPQEWLTDLGITFTAGPMNLNWKNLLMTINDDDHFWDDVDEYGVSKPQG